MRSEPGRHQRLRVGFVMEQALGHVTHYRNLRQFTDGQPDIDPVWLPIPFGVTGLARVVPLLRSNWSVRASLRARRGLDAINAAESVDALFFHSQVTSLFSANLMRRLPSVISLDATPINYDSVGKYYGHKPAGNGFLDRKKYELNLHAYRSARGFVTWSDWARRSLIDDYAVPSEQIRVVPPGASSSYFEIGDSRQHTLGRESGRVRLLFVGADFGRKGGQLLLDVMRGSLGERCELHVVTRSTLPAQPNVFVHNDVEPNSPTLRDLFARADIFVLPTHADCLALVLEEAAAAGLPVVTTAVGALNEAVADGESGMVVPPGDLRALELALQPLVDDTSKRRQMGRAAYDLACRKFDANRNNRAVLDFISDVARRSIRMTTAA